MKPHDQEQDDNQVDDQNDTGIFGPNGEIDAKMYVRRYKDNFVINIKLDNVLLAKFVNSFLLGYSYQSPSEKGDNASIQPQGQDHVDAEKEKSHPECSSLTDREIEILNRLSTGLLNKEIADDMGLSINTVKNHLQNIYSKLCVENRTEAILRYFDRLAKKE